MRLGSSQSLGSEDDDSDALSLLFIPCSPRMTETFASLGPNCLFYCNCMLEDFLWSLVSFLFSSSWSLFFWGKLFKIAAVLCRNTACSVGCSCFLPNKSGTEPMSEGRTRAEEFCEAGCVTFLARVSGLVPLVVDGCSEMLVHITGLSSIQLVMLAEILPGSYVHQLCDGSRETSLFSGSRLQQWLRWPISSKLFQRVQ